MNNTLEIQPLKQLEYTERLEKEIRQRSNKIIEIFLIGYFLFGLVIASFYDTWFIAVTIGSLLLATYFLSKKLFPESSLNQYIASAAVGVYMGQFIYQMHGMFEMHFFAFIGATLLITYQNWKVQIPLALIIVLHHAVFGYIQYISFTSNTENTVYFTQLNYMDLQTFIIHCFLAIVILVICCLWAYDLNRRTRENAQNIAIVEEITKKLTMNLEFASHLVNGDYDQKYEVDEEDPLGSVLKELHKKLSSSN